MNSRELGKEGLGTAPLLTPIHCGLPLALRLYNFRHIFPTPFGYLATESGLQRVPG